MCLKEHGSVNITNFDDLIESGIYVTNGKNETGEEFTSATKNSPIGVYKYGKIIVFGKNTPRVQIYIPDAYSAFGVYIRIISSYGWFKINTIKL